MRGIEPLMSHLEAVGYRIPPEVLREKVALFDWRELFLKASAIASLLANDDDGLVGAAAQRAVVEPLARLHSSAAVWERSIGTYVRGQHPSRPLANEEAVYFVEALAILHGAENGAVPNDETVALFLLAANDYVTEFQRPEGPTVTRKARLAALSARAAIFNHRRDPVRFFVRSHEIFKTPPPRTPELSDNHLWQAFQSAAFEMPFQEYLDCFAGPLAMISMNWGQTAADGRMEPPIVYPSKWLGETLLKGDRAETFFATLSGTREAAREALSRGLDENGLPRAVAYFQRVPFIRFEDDTLVAASPWALRAHLKGGLWARHLQQAKNQFGSKGPQIWMSAFGGLFENWCRTVAQMASAHRCFHGQVIIPKDIGVREIEDVVHLDQSEVVLFSAKASMVPEAQLRDALEAADVIAWYERFLFSEKSERYRMGALRLLDNKCTELRNRAYEPTIAHHVRVYPVLVTFDDVGDSAGMYNWVSARCNELGLFKQPRVHCPTFMSINEYEMLMAAAAHGHSISAIMRRKVDREHSIASFSWVAHQLVPDSAHHRLPEIEALYKENNDRMSTALFGRPIRERDSKRE